MKRRDVILGTAGLGAVAALGPRWAGRAQAQTKPAQLVLMTWGGQWGDAMREGPVATFTARTGIKVVQDRSGSPADRITKIKLSATDGRYDLVQLHDGLVPLAVAQGVLEPLDPASPRLANLARIPPHFIRGPWVAMIYSLLGIAYNTKLVKTPPTSFADLWRPEFKGQIVLPEITHSLGPYIVPIGAMAAGRPPTDEEAGFEMLKRLVGLQPTWAKDTDSILGGLRSEEAVIGLLYRAQTFTLQDGSTPLAWVHPREGAILYSVGTGIAKGSRNRDWAEDFINETLAPSTQQIFAERFNYPGTNRDTEAALPASLRARVRSIPEANGRVVELDQAILAEKRAAWTDRWNRIVSAG